MTAKIATVKKGKIKKCPECKSTNVIERKNENCSLCMECGFVISPGTIKLNTKEETLSKMNSFPDSIVPLSKKAPSKDHEKGNIIKALENMKIEDSWEKNLVKALQQVTQIAFDLSLPEVALEKAALIYKQITEKGLTRGRSMKTMSATVVYLCCEQNQIGVTIKDIARTSRISPKKIIRSCKRITKLLGFLVQPAKIDDHLIEISKRLQLPSPTIELAHKIIKAFERAQGLIGKDPCGVVCGAIYISAIFSGERITQREISQTGNLTETTVRARVRELKRNLAFNFSL